MTRTPGENPLGNIFFGKSIKTLAITPNGRYNIVRKREGDFPRS
nr:MAG TPA: hypothetical protein [Caudoviricetes sp.]